MSSDFLNFGTSAIEMAGVTGIVGEEMKMLKGITKGGGPHKCQHCGSMHPNRTSLIHHMRKEHGEGHETGYASRKGDWQYDFRI